MRTTLSLLKRNGFSLSMELKGLESPESFSFEAIFTSRRSRYKVPGRLLALGLFHGIVPLSPSPRLSLPGATGRGSGGPGERGAGDTNTR